MKDDNFWLIVAGKAYESVRNFYADEVKDAEVPDFNGLTPEHRDAWVKAIQVAVRTVVSEGRKALNEGPRDTA